MEENDANFTARSYQIELFEYAKTRNSILVLGTGSGKTFISILLIKELGDVIRGSFKNGAKRTVFLVNNVPLVYQQAEAIEQHTAFSVGKYEGSMGVDLWDEGKWLDEIEKNEVVVLSAQIFLDLLMHNRLPLSKVNLLIMDECHHATGNHPMREVMREYNLAKANSVNVPRIMGLTACVIAKRCSLASISTVMHDLEVVLDSVLITSENQVKVEKFSTCAKEMIIKCPVIQPAAKFQIVLDYLTAVALEVDFFIDNMNIVEEIKRDKIKKRIKKLLRGISDVTLEVGPYVLDKIIQFQVEFIEEMECDNPDEVIVMDQLKTKLNFCLSTYFDGSTLHLNDNDFSGKLVRLVEILRQKSCRDKTILVFATKRNTVKLLNYMLKVLKETDESLTYLRPEHIVGSVFNLKNDLKVYQEEMRKQRKIIEQFKRGEFNIIVSTSVLEEGFDVKKCNLVIRYDAPMNYRAYIQSLGRARANPSYYLTLSYEENSSDVMKSYCFYKALNDYITIACHRRLSPTLQESKENFSSDLIEESFCPYGYPGPRVSFNSAIQLINRYCGTLPADRYTNLTVTVNKRIVTVNDTEHTVVDLTLPISSPFRATVSGKPMQNADFAKKSAALELCKRLFEYSVFDKDMLPIRNCLDSKSYVKTSEEMDTDNHKEKPGTKARRRLYEKKVCAPFSSGSFAENDAFLHLLNFTQIQPGKEGFLLDSTLTNSYLGIICSKKINCCDFPLYSRKWGHISISVKFIENKILTPVEHAKIRLFHQKIYQCLLNLNENLFSFGHEELCISVLLVPLKNNLNIDMTTVESMNDFDLIKESQRILEKVKKKEDFIFSEQAYENKAVIPCYNTDRFYMVLNINAQLTPMSPFPESKKIYATYCDYMEKQYNITISNFHQPLLECKHFSLEFNYLKIIDDLTLKISSTKHPYLIPELCVIFPISASSWHQFLCIPSILLRINGLMLEQELFGKISREKSFSGLPIHNFSRNISEKSLNYNWANEEMGQLMYEDCSPLYTTSNLAIALSEKSTFSVWPGMLLQCLTPLVTSDNFNLERLEILGDSYLKFSVSLFLYCQESNAHEGMLTTLRSDIVSNKTLYLLGKEKCIGNFIQGASLSAENAFPYGFSAKNCLKRDRVLFNDNGESLNHAQSVIDSFNGRFKQWISDKSVADVVEALIGSFILCGGVKTADCFMHWIGMTFIINKITLPLTAIVSVNIEADKSVKMVDYLYYKYCLDRLESILGYSFKNRSFIVQALTHPTYTNNLVTDCYQRLEFLGDAVLDYLISCYIFSTFKDFDPGQLTDIRSYYVNNETLGTIAIQFGFDKFLLHMSPSLDHAIGVFKSMLDEGEEQFTSEKIIYESPEVEIPKALGDIVESIIGAVYIDSNGSLTVTWELVFKLLKSEFISTKNNIPINSVRALYEKNPHILLTPVPPTDDEPAKYIVMMDGFQDITGIGKNLKTAKQAAAKLALYHLNLRESK